MRYLPLLDAAQRKLYCSLPDWAAQVLGSLVTPHSRGGFVLQVGYFQATGRFFSTDRFRAADGAYVQQRYRLGPVEWARKPTMAVHAGTKNAVRAITEGLRQEAGDKLRVTGISPGFVQTNFADSMTNPAIKAQIVEKMGKLPFRRRPSPGP